MKLFQAIHSGKPFKQKNSTKVYYNVGELYDDLYMMKRGYFVDSLISDSWEVLKEPCNHEPKRWFQKHDTLRNFETFEMVCYRCGAKIWAKEWIADEQG